MVVTLRVMTAEARWQAIFCEQAARLLGEPNVLARIAQVHQPPGEKSPGICPIEELHV